MRFFQKALLPICLCILSSLAIPSFALDEVALVKKQCELKYGNSSKYRTCLELEILKLQSKNIVLEKKNVDGRTLQRGVDCARIASQMGVAKIAGPVTSTLGEKVRNHIAKGAVKRIFGTKAPSDAQCIRAVQAVANQISNKCKRWVDRNVELIDERGNLYSNGKLLKIPSDCE